MTLPSGFEVDIRRISIIDFADLGKFPFLGDPEGALGSSPELQKRLLAYCDRAIVRGAVDPVFTDRDDESGREDRVDVRDLSFDDHCALAGAIFDWSFHHEEESGRRNRLLH